MTPAEELRTAAHLLRDKATAAHRASPGPWAVTDEHVVRCADGMVVADRSGTDHPAERADLPYIAAMAPGVGLALADWLEAVADGMSVAKVTDYAALAVARQVSGTVAAPTTAPAEHVHRLGTPDDDGILDDWDNCRDPECPGPATPAPSEEPK